MTGRGWCLLAGGSTRSLRRPAYRLPEGDDYETVSGLVMARLGRIPDVGDEFVIELPHRFDHDGRPVPPEYVRLTVQTVERHVPGIVVMERTGMSTTLALLISAVLLVLNGFFVAAEFALVASKRHRLEAGGRVGQPLGPRRDRRRQRAVADARGRTARHHLVHAGPRLAVANRPSRICCIRSSSWSHIPEGVGHVIALIIAVAGIGLLHVLLGEMAPKSWAISDPERAALVLAMPFRGFTFVFRPLLIVLNWIANLCVRLVGVTPQNEIANAHGPDELRLLIESSREHGTLEQPEHDLLTAMLALQNTTVGQVMTPICPAVHGPGVRVGPRGGADQPPRGPLPPRGSRPRPDGSTGICGIVHVRDAARVTTAGDTASRASDLMTRGRYDWATTPRSPRRSARCATNAPS